MLGSIQRFSFTRRAFLAFLVFVVLVCVLPFYLFVSQSLPHPHNYNDGRHDELPSGSGASGGDKVSIEIEPAEGGVSIAVPAERRVFNPCEDVKTVRSLGKAIQVENDFVKYEFGKPYPEWVPLRRGASPLRGKDKRQWVNISNVKPNSQCRDRTVKTRNYYEDPVIVWKSDAPMNEVRFFDGKDPSHWTHCDIPCGMTSSSSYNLRFDGFFKLYESSRESRRFCDHQYVCLGTMESDEYYPGVHYNLYKQQTQNRAYDMLATTDFRSDIPLQYFSWEEYDIGRRVFEKRTDAHLIMAISNCNDNVGRLHYLRDLAKNGIIIHSFGGCDHNADMPHSCPGVDRVQRWEMKQIMAVRYPFTAAMENSASQYYVTEKMMDALIAGSIPIHKGQNHERLKHFCPNDHSCLNTADFESPAHMAKHMLYLMSNQTAYNEYLEWKSKGTSREFRATMDLSRIHSTCRFCIRIADFNRWRLNFTHDLEEQNPFHEINAKTLAEYEKSTSPDKLLLRVRERGTFWFTLIYLSERTPQEFRKQVYDKFSPFSEHWTQHLVRKSALDEIKEITTEEDFKNLKDYDELEVILFWY